MSLLRTSDVSETKLTFVAADINFFNADIVAVRHICANGGSQPKAGQVHKGREACVIGLTLHFGRAPDRITA